MHFYTENNPFGRDVTLILNDQDETCSEITGDDHEAIAKLIAEEWNELWQDIGEAGA